MNAFKELFNKRAKVFKTQATHTDVHGALYKYVNGRLFHFHFHRYYHRMVDLPVWGIFNSPKGHEIFEIGKTK